MKTKCLKALVILTTMALIYGCGSGSKNGGNSAPKTPGDAAELVGTVWTNTETNTTYTFKDTKNVSISVPSLQQPLPGTYSVNDKGILELNQGLQSLSGTWDGKDLMIRGQKLVKQ